MERPEISVIIPVYRAEVTLPRALASVMASGMPPDQVEVVLASDDGTDYRELAPDGLRVSATPLGPVRTGPGAARNRALAQAQGRFYAFLDADDSWEPGYLAALLPLARRHGAAFGQTSVLDAGQQILRMPQGADRLRLQDLGHYGGSFHPLLARAQARPFTSHPSQDVRHAAELLARLGGSAPLAPVAYQLRLSESSVTAETDFSDRVARAYACHVSEILAGAGDLPEAMRAPCAEVFRAKARLNTAYGREARPGQSFYGFIAERLARAEPARR
ncbi:Glycosyl transferase family 2 [Pseudooceanicola antarcticus]|uniref:Glycosyl transferase family 2 n=1 Tax=Pseudooceanicola antarcticus TaxID=1247613 RepID=A0A285IK83_9RHOB|nr:glycosyltransferase family 2 protein [Pseudooceanicola antarcticus]PJE28738.1 glycosyltransferase family 2 protein [Pseudooceanicola antarcticus]SNY48378.1 Glycosyl transferase family 2 [Pseudooceanicola antarcticus]